ncbi:MAG TPA: PEP-CTERM sorting domain-containing protein [Opitutaceae bacterium]|nr:PEP-CTERM sorting domain-containing protein [Opitutaceae bacterium]
MKTKLAILSVISAALLTTTAFAQIVAVHGSTAAPGAALGPYTMTSFGADLRPAFSSVSSVDSPLGGSVLFSTPQEIRSIGGGWATWSHGYTGTVYFGGGTSLTLTLPTQTWAFYFYIEPDPFSDVSFTFTSGDNSFSEVVNGNSAAEYIGFYGLNGSTIDSINISADTGFAVGEFAIASSFGGAVPEPSTYGLLGAAALCGLIAFRRFRRR